MALMKTFLDIIQIIEFFTLIFKKVILFIDMLLENIA